MTIEFGLGVGPGHGRSFVVEERPRGILIFGSLPVDEFAALAKAWTKRGWDLLDTGVASALGAAFAVTSKADSKAWRAEIEADLARRYDGKPELAWLLGTDTGFSSLEIFYTLAADETARGGAEARLKRGSGSSGFGNPPQDPDDVGRCVRLLDRFPAWRGRLREVSEAYDRWRLFVPAWDELEALYREEVPNHEGAAPRLFERLKALHAEAAIGDRR
jgi:hypothetical protein